MRKIASNDAITLKLSSSLIVCVEGEEGKRRNMAVVNAKLKWPEADGYEAHFCILGDKLEKRELLDLVWDCTSREAGR